MNQQPGGKMNSNTLAIADIKNETKTPAIIINQQGFITYINAPFEAAFGWQAADLVGKPISTIIPSTMHDAHHLGFSRFVTTGQPHILNQSIKLTAKNKLGDVFEAEHFIIAERQNNEWLIGATIRPLST